MDGSLGSECSIVVIPFRSIYSLNTYEVRICSLPSSWYCRSVEVDHQMMPCGTFQQVDTVFHRLLLVSGEEINLHSCHTHLLKPCKLPLAVFGGIQSLMRSRCAPCLNPCSRRIIPQYRFDAFVEGIAYGILDVATILHLVPFGINKHVWPVHLHCHIHVFLYNLIVIAAMVVSPVYPRHRARFYPRCVFYTARITDIGDKSRCHHILQLSHYYHSPWRLPLPSDVLQVFIHHNTVFLLVAVVIERRCTVQSLYTSLGNQGKYIVGRLNKSRIAPTLVFVLASCR